MWEEILVSPGSACLSIFPTIITGMLVLGVVLNPEVPGFTCAAGRGRAGPGCDPAVP